MAPTGIFLGSRIVDKNLTKPIGNQSWEVALRPGTARKTSNSRFRTLFLYAGVFLSADHWTDIAGPQIYHLSFYLLAVAKTQSAYEWT